LKSIDAFRHALRRVIGGEPQAGVADYARRVLGFEADAAQARVLDAGGVAGAGLRVLLCCSRQWGKSTTAAALMTHRAVTREGSLVLCVAPTLRQSAELMRKVGEFLGRAGVRFVGGRLRCELANGSRIVAVPGNEANVRGFSAPSLIVIDEAARVPDLLYKAVRPMLVVGKGDLALLSTPFGERGFFWKEWAAGGERWLRVEGKATDCPRISAEVLEEERAAQSAEWFAQEYLCSFVGMENQAFRQEWLDAAVAEGVGVEALDFKLKGGMF
jgi:hypothetical protein